MDIDRNLLFGMLALDADVLTPHQLAEACTAWAARKDRPLADILQDRGLVAGRDRSLVEYLVERKLKKHGGSVRESLAATASPAVRQSLASVRDREVQRCLAELPPAQAVAAPAPAASRAEVRDRHTLIHLHALGGVSQVWLARDPDIGREVALKEIRPEQVNNAAVTQRILNEARITGRLEHPSIVPIHLVAPHPVSKQPYYTMRFVRGRNLSDAIRSYHDRRLLGTAEPLEFRQLLQAFVDVSQAVAYAHSRFVIHRDLRPQNVVLGDFGEAIILDWGSAKVIEPPAPTGAATEAEPAPAPSAESLNGHQATNADGQAAPASAVSTPAYQSPEQAAGRIQEVDQSSDIYGLGAMLYEILTGVPPFEGDPTTILDQVLHHAPKRPRSLIPSLPPALEAVCLKALSKRPASRYAHASELAHEIQCWLADEPVQAYADSLVGSTRRWLRQHPSLAAAAACGVLGLFLCLVAAAWSLNGAREQSDAARNRALQEKTRADLNLVRARRAIEEFMALTKTEPGLKDADNNPLRKRLLETALSFHLDLLYQLGEDLNLRADRADVQSQLGALYSALGQPAKALEAYDTARGTYRSLLQVEPRNHHTRHALAAIYHALAQQHLAMGQRDEAEPNLREAVRLFDEMPPAQAGPKQRRQQLARHVTGLADLLAEQARWREADEQYRRSIEILEFVLRGAGDDVEIQGDLANCCSHLAEVLARRGYHEEAEQLYRRAVDLGEAVIAKNPSYRPDLINNCHRFGAFLELVGRRDAALSLHRQALALMLQLARAYPSAPQYRSELADAHTRLGRALNATRSFAAAEMQHREALTLQARLREDYPQLNRYAAEYGATLVELANVTRDQGQPDASLRRYDEAVDLLTRVRAKEPELQLTLRALRDAYRERARAFSASGKKANALKDLQEAIQLDPDKLPMLRAEQATLLARLGKGSEALAEAQVLLAGIELPSPVLFELARALAVNAALGEASQGAPSASLAVDVLNRAHAQGGLSNPERTRELQSHADFKGLHEVNGFKKLLAELAASRGP
jgi:serine/threonine-protein kinase